MNFGPFEILKILTPDIFDDDSKSGVVTRSKFKQKKKEKEKRVRSSLGKGREVQQHRDITQTTTQTIIRVILFGSRSSRVFKDEICVY